MLLQWKIINQVSLWQLLKGGTSMHRCELFKVLREVFFGWLIAKKEACLCFFVVPVLNGYLRCYEALDRCVGRIRSSVGIFFIHFEIKILYLVFLTTKSYFVFHQPMYVGIVLLKTFWTLNNYKRRLFSADQALNLDKVFIVLRKIPTYLVCCGYTYLSTYINVF